MIRSRLIRSCLTITGGQLAVGTKKEVVGIMRCRSKKKKKKKISQPSLALSPEHLQRKGKKTIMFFGLCILGLPKELPLALKEQNKEPVPEERKKRLMQGT